VLRAHREAIKNLNLNTLRQVQQETQHILDSVNRQGPSEVQQVPPRNRNSAQRTEVRAADSNSSNETASNILGAS